MDLFGDLFHKAELAYLKLYRENLDLELVSLVNKEIIWKRETYSLERARIPQRTRSTNVKFDDRSTKKEQLIILVRFS